MKNIDLPVIWEKNLLLASLIISVLGLGRHLIDHCHLIPKVQVLVKDTRHSLWKLPNYSTGTDISNPGEGQHPMQKSGKNGTFQTLRISSTWSGGTRISMKQNEWIWYSQEVYQSTEKISNTTSIILYLNGETLKILETACFEELVFCK